MNAGARAALRFAGRAGRRVARAMAWTGLAVGMAVASVLLHLDTPVVRRVAIAQVNQLVFEPLFRGTMVIVTLGHVDPLGVSGVSVRVRDPAGQPVLSVDGLASRIALPRLVWTAVAGQGDIVIDLSGVSIENVDIRLDAGDDGVALANTYLLKGPPSAAPPASTPGRGVRLAIPSAHIGHAWVHGLVAGVPYLDADVTGLDAAFAVTPDRLEATLRRADVVARGIALGADARGALAGQFELKLDTTSAMGGRVDWSGAAGDLHETVAASLLDGRFDASVDVPDAPPEAIRSIWTASTISSSGSAHVEAHGPLESIAVSAHASLAEAAADVRGELRWGSERRAKLHLDVVGVDLRQLAPAAPSSSLGTSGDVTLSLTADGRLDGQATLDLAAGHVAALPVPHATLETSGFRVATGAFGGDASLMIDEPGAPATVTLHAVPRGDSSSVDFTVASRDVRLGALSRFSTDATGNVRVLGRGNIDLDRLAVDVSVDTHADTVARGSLRVGAIAARGRLRGSLGDPEVDAALQASGVGWGGKTLSQLDVTARGRARSLHCTVHERSRDVPDLDAEAEVELFDGPTLRHVDARVSRLGETAHVRIERARFESPAIDVEDLVVDGIGAPLMASFRIAGSSVRLKATAPRLDVGRLAKLTMLDATVRGGTIAIDVNGAVHGAAAEGTARITLEHGAVGDVREVGAHLEGEMTGRRFAGAAGVAASDVGSIELTAKELVVGGRAQPVGASALRKAWGDVRLVGHVDLAKLQEYLPPGTLPVSSVRGTVELNGRFQRDNEGDFTPLVQLDATTSGLMVRVLAPPAPATDGAHEAPTWTLAGVDLTTSLRVNGDTGFLELSTQIRDAGGVVAVVDARAPGLPYRALYEAPGDALALLPKTPFRGHVSLPPRALATWPAALGHPPVDGVLQADVTIDGPLVAPHVVASAHLASAATSFARLASPLDLDLHATYDGALAGVELRGRDASHEVLAAEGHASVRAAELVAGATDPAWRASAKVHVDSFPLAAIGPLDDDQVRGLVTGDVELDDLHAGARGKATLSVSGLKVGDTRYSNANAMLAADGRTVSADVRLDEAQGFATLKATVPATWGTALLPAPDPKQNLALDLQAKHFRAAVLLPFLRRSIDQLDGLIDADAHVTVDPGSRAVHLQGTAEVKEGLVQVASFGGELHDIDGKVTVTPEGVLTVDHLTAFGINGELIASARAHLDGLRLDGATATIDIPKAHGIPLSVGGALFGTVDGKVDVTETVSADRHSLDLKVDVPTLHLLVPEKGSQDVQPLGPIADVTVGTSRSGLFVQGAEDADEQPSAAPAVVRPEDAVTIHVATHLGNDVVLRRGTDVRVELTGGPTVTITDKARVSGQIQLRGGFLSVYGKKFEIERGTVSFVGTDPGNPQVSVTAAWTASDGTRVIAEFVGPLKSGKVTLHSEPAQTPNDIVQLLLFGAIEEGQAASAAGTPGTSSAEGVAGNLATQPLNRALDQFGLSAVSARVDTSSANAKPEVVVQIARDISIQLAYVLFIGPPPPGTSPDTTLLTIDWRFLRKWSLEGSVGNAGTTIVDLVWKYRY